MIKDAAVCPQKLSLAKLHQRELGPDSRILQESLISVLADASPLIVVQCQLSHATPDFFEANAKPMMDLTSLGFDSFMSLFISWFVTSSSTVVAESTESTLPASAQRQPLAT